MRKGFTIIEVIVTFVILSILIFFAIYSFRYSVANVNKASYYLPRTIISYSTIEKVLSGIYFYVIEKEKKKFFDFFEGNSDHITFITTSAFFTDKISIASLSYQNHKLIYREEPLYSKNMNFAKPAISQYAQQIVLSESISSCSITYLLHNGETTSEVLNQIPVGITIKFNKNSKNYHYIFSIQSDFLHNKVLQFNEKYPI